LAETYHETLRSVRETAIAAELAAAGGNGSGRSLGQYHDLMQRMADAAETYALVHDLEEARARQLMSEAISLCRALRQARGPADNRPFEVWTHKPISDPFREPVGAFSIDRAALEQCVSSYLGLPFRAQAMDRILVDGLVGVEVLRFARDIYRRPKVQLLLSLAPGQRRYVWVIWLVGALFAIAIFGGVAALFFHLANTGGMRGDWAAGFGVILIGLLVLSIGWSILALPLRWRKEMQDRTALKSIWDDIADLFNELGSAGSVNSDEIRELATKVGTKGVVLPPSLFPLLEDIKARGGAF
jgi:hypothetical protein